jgi:hypothetical protein
MTKRSQRLCAKRLSTAKYIAFGRNEKLRRVDGLSNRFHRLYFFGTNEIHIVWAEVRKGGSTMKEAETSGIAKRYLKSRPVCKVTFRLPVETVPAAESVVVVGDFNDWNKEATPMTRQKNGDFAVVVELPAGSEYRFRYCIDRELWVNDPHADHYEPNSFGGEDSVVVV